MRRVAVTGLGVIASLGHGVEPFFTALLAGRSGVRRLTPGSQDTLRSAIGAPVDFDGGAHFAVPRLRMLDRVSQLALVAASQAIAAAGVDFARERAERCGVCMGTAMGGSQRVKPYSVLNAMTNAAASWIGIDHGLSGPNLTYSTACSSGAVAIGEAARRIQCGDADVMLAGGAEAPLTFGVLRAWEAMRTLAVPDPTDISASCRPFSRTRTGLVLGEGAAIVVLEAWEHACDRGAAIHAELCGYGLTTDVGHITRPSVEGQAGAMRAALAAAGLHPDAVDYINAHGTGTQQNDAVETNALKAVFGPRAYRVPVSSTKSMHAHLLGASGALEFVIAVMCLERSVVPPTMHLDCPDAECDLDYVPGQARQANRLQTVMSNSFAFGGTNAVLVARAPYAH